MPIRVVEFLSRSKLGCESGGEDRWFANDHFAAVIDGATSLTHSGVQPPPGRQAAEWIADAIGRLPMDSDAPDAIASLSAAMAAQIENTRTLVEDPVCRPSASVVIFSHARRELWMVGDCQALLIPESEPPILVENAKAIDQVVADARSIVLQARQQQGDRPHDLRCADPGRAAVEPLLRAQRWLQNNDVSEWSYWVLDGRPPPNRAIRVIPAPPVTRGLVLASDGYFALHPTLAETEAELVTLLTADEWAPLLFRGDYKSTKGVPPAGESFDDRTYLRIAW